MYCKSLLFYLVYAVVITTIGVDCHIETGCSAYNCKRFCMKAPATPGDNGFKFEFEKSDNKYISGATYKGK